LVGLYALQGAKFSSDAENDEAAKAREDIGSVASFYQFSLSRPWPHYLRAKAKNKQAIGNGKNKKKGSPNY
jgi:hypothetical protein